jgi:two-component system, OmpR family, response regulator
MRVLVIEDDEETAALIGGGLKARGRDTALAKDGRDGFRLAVAERFDAIILDRMLPALDGLGVVALMRAEGLATPVIFLTNLAGVIGLRGGRAAGLAAAR